MKNLTKYLLLASLLLTLSFTSFAQNSSDKIGTPEYLLVKKGFKIFKLGAPIEQYKKYALLIDNNQQKGYKVYKVGVYPDPSLFEIGNSIELNAILLYVYDGFIIAIGVYIEDEYKKHLLRSLQAAYGSGEKENPYIEEYNWIASNKKDNIRLSYGTNFEGGATAQ